MKEKSKVIAIASPTATGKSKFAVELAKKINGEIISADSRLVYNGFNIAVAKPTKEEKGNIKHYLIDIVEPEYDYTVSDFYKDATNAIKEIISHKKTPIIVGGTGLYFRILLEGYKLTDVKPDLKLRQELSLLSKEELLLIFEKLDKKSFQNITDIDKRKLIRKIEICKSLGKPISEIEQKQEVPYKVEWIGINMPRDEIYNRINSRVDRMFEDGIVDETKNLLKKHGRIKNIVDTIGYKEVIQYLDGEIDLERAKELLKQHTRNYAKRQLTWFRKNEALGLS
jgi:tRNA dimethylallyltransferase